MNAVLNLTQQSQEMQAMATEMMRAGLIVRL